MLIGIDANEANNKYRVGIGRYAYKLLEGIYLNNRKKPRKNLFFRIYLKSSPRPEMPEQNRWWQYEVFGQKGLWVEKNLMPKLWMEKLSRKNPDVFWSLTHYSPVPVPIKSVVSIMDLAYLRFPQYFKKSDLIKLKYWTRLSIRQAEKIFTISRFTKDEIILFYPEVKDKISVIYPGFEREKFNIRVKSESQKIEEARKKYNCPQNYLLYIGTSQPRKNLTRLVRAFAEVMKKRNDLYLVIAGMIHEGRGGWMYEEIYETISDLNLKNRIIFTGYVEDADITYLLAGSTGLILPSLYEGFGLPVVEAMAIGIPVVASCNSSLSEAGGKVAIYIKNPYNTGSIRSALHELLTLSREEREKMKNRGVDYVRQFSWEKAAEKALFELIKLGNKK